MKWFETVLDAKAKKAADRVATALKGEFYLAGGTALALQLGHRVSLDLDLFSQANALGAGNREAILAVLRSSGTLEVVESREGTCHLIVQQRSISLLHYPYSLIEKASLRWRGIPVAGMRDISAMKLSAVLGRGAKKDFVDLYFLCKKLGISEVLDAGVKKFPDHRAFPVAACRALVYFDDAEKEPMPRMLEKVKWEKIRNYFTFEIPRILRKRL